MGDRFGIVGALTAFPRRLAVCEVEKQDGHLRSGVTRRTTHVVLARQLLASATDAEIEQCVTRERRAGRYLLSENGFLEMLGLRQRSEPAEISRAMLLERSRISERDFDLLSLFDAFEHGSEPYSFRDVGLAKRYAALLEKGASWSEIARSIHRSPAASMIGLAGAPDAPSGDKSSSRLVGGCASGFKGQTLPGIRIDETELESLFAQAEEAEADERLGEAVALYQRCLSIDPADAEAAYNLGNCLLAAERPEDACQAYERALKRDPDFVEALYNLACTLKTQGQVEAARRYLLRALAVDEDYADAIYNLATLEFEAGRLLEARRWWSRYLELDTKSNWARLAARGVRYVERQSPQPIQAE